MDSERIVPRKSPLSNSLSMNQKRHFTFWIKFGLSAKFGLIEKLSEKLVQKVKSPSDLRIFVNTMLKFELVGTPSTSTMIAVLSC